MAYGVVDTDIHPLIGNIGEALPYMSSNWQRRLEPRKDLRFDTHLPGRGPRFNDGFLKIDATPPNGGLPGSDPEFLVTDHLDGHNIEIGLLLAAEPSRTETWTNPDEAAVLASACNDLLLERWVDVDPRFRLAMNVSPHDAELAANEIHRLGEDDRVVAVWLPMIQRLLGDRHFYPIYKAASERGLPIVLHPNGSEGDYYGSVNFAGGTPPSRQERYSLLGQFAQSNVASLVFEGVFERFPRLKVVFTEYGFSWVAPLMWRLDATWKAGRASMPWVKRSPTDYMLDHIRFTTEPSLEIPTESELMAIVEMMHGERTLLYSSDYPHWDGEENPTSVFKSASEDVRRRIFRENALETFERISVREPVA